MTTLITKEQLTDLRSLIICEISDFFAGFGCPGEPETPEEMQRELTMRVGRILISHILNYPRCEALVEILRECRKARDEAQAELQERRKAAMDAEPVADVVSWSHPNHPDTTCNVRLRRFELAPGPLFAVAQPVAVVPDEMAISDDMNLYQKSFAQGHNACRAAMLQEGKS
ncbi:hypothetical protein PO428_21910 [Escherichia coli]